MKKLTKLFTLTLALVFTLTCFSFLSGAKLTQVSALSASYNGEDETIYYFYNHTPVLSPTRVGALGFNVVYDHQPGLTQESFSSMVANGYFNGFGNNCIVVLDICQLPISSSVLEVLFNNLINTQGCKVIFATNVQTADYSAYDQDVFKLIDTVNAVTSSGDELCDKFNDFIVKSLSNFNGSASIPSLSSAVILLDGSYLDTNMYIDSFSNICNTSVTIKAIVDNLIPYIIGGNSYTSPFDYAYVANNLFAEKVKLLIHTGGTNFVDIVTQTTYTEANMLDLRSFGSSPCEKVCAIANWTMDDDLYDFLFENQQAEDFPVYLYEVNPISYGSNGLSVITDTALGVTTVSADDIEGTLGGFIDTM